MRSVKFLCGVVSIAGFILILGTAGASDLESIPMDQVLTQSLVGLGLLVLGFIGYQIIKEVEWRRNVPSAKNTGI